MNYTLHQLRIFQKIVEKESITKAANELFLSQPAVSIQLKNLQDQFEIPLTEVIGRKLYITEFGKELAKSSLKILNEVHDIKHKVMAYKGHVSGQLRFSAVSTAKYVIPYFLTEFINKYEAVDLNIDVTNKAMVIESLERNEVDFAMVSVLPEKLNIDRIELLQNKLFLVGNKQLLIGKKHLENKQIEELPLIFREKGSATRQAMEDFIEKNQLVVKKKLELTSNEAVKQAVIAGLGYSIMPIIGIGSELRSKELYIIPMKQLPIITEWNLIWLKNKKFSPAAVAFIQHLNSNKETIINNKFNWFESF